MQFFDLIMYKGYKAINLLVKYILQNLSAHTDQRSSVKLEVHSYEVIRI